MPCELSLKGHPFFHKTGESEDPIKLLVSLFQLRRAGALRIRAG
jgi:hypothetical protein